MFSILFGYIIILLFWFVIAAKFKPELLIVKGDTLYWVLSTLAQVSGALIGLIGIIVIYALDKISSIKQGIEFILFEKEKLFYNNKLKDDDKDLMKSMVESITKIMKLMNEERKILISDFFIALSVLTFMVIYSIFSLNFCNVGPWDLSNPYVFCVYYIFVFVVPTVGLLWVFMFTWNLRKLAKDYEDYEKIKLMHYVERGRLDELR
jgi:hypothetical protein